MVICMMTDIVYPDIFYELFADILNSEKIRISVETENTQRLCYCEKTHRLTDEKYILKISGNDITVTCSGEKSLFYALSDIVLRVEENTLTDGEFVCSPSFAVRGYIEGFYGAPWGHGKRKSFMSLMAKNRMNTVYYAPKDDLYHREKWNEAYPEEELDRLKELVDLARSYYMSFYWCVAPGLSMKYSDEKDFEALVNKTRQLYSIGVRHFGLLLDDISEELENAEDREKYGETVNAHIELINRYFSFLTQLDASVRLTVCPTLYHGKGNEYYIAKLGQHIPPLVSLFWTGRDICSRELLSLDAIRFVENTFHKPLYWDNYPVNDCAMFNEMHIGPIINREKDLCRFSEGIIANCMEYAECSKIPLITVAQYLWDSENYEPQPSWENAIAQVVGRENADSFIVFAEHLRTSCLKDANSRYMYEVFDKIEASIKKGDMNTAFSCASEYLARIKACCEYLKRDLPLCKELKAWAEKFFVMSELINKIFALAVSRNEVLMSEIDALTEKFVSMPVRLSDDINIKEMLREQFNINL